jgi:hypothetical protein
MFAMEQRVQPVLRELLVRKEQLVHKVLQVQMVRTELTAQMDKTPW